ncbi:hypothetical protein D3C81_721870 [compost metagenome]
MRRTFGGDGHANIRTDALVAQVMGQAVGLLMQAGVIEAATLPYQGSALWSQTCLLVELVDHPLLRRYRRRLPPCEQLPAAIGVKQLHSADGDLRLSADLFQQTDQLCADSCDGRRIEQLHGVVERQDQAALMVFFTVQLQIELGFAAVPRQFFGKQPREATQGAEVALLVVEHDLEQALLASFGEGFEQLFERQVLVGLGLQRGLAHLGQQLVERQAPIELRTQYLGVDEKAHQALGFQARTVGVGHADADVGLPAVAMQQALETGQQDHEQRGVMGAGDTAQSFRQGGLQAHAQAGGGVAVAV